MFIFSDVICACVYMSVYKNVNIKLVSPVNSQLLTMFRQQARPPYVLYEASELLNVRYVGLHYGWNCVRLSNGRLAKQGFNVHSVAVRSRLSVTQEDSPIINLP